jgi:hypothetical protein
MYRFGPYGPTHSTAATFAFRKELLKETSFDNNTSVAEEKHFLKNYTIPFVQLDTQKSILVFSHNHNSFDKKELLLQLPNPTIHETTLLPKDLVKEPEILKFFVEDIDNLLEKYEAGKIEFKPDVQKQIKEMKIERENKIQEITKKQTEYNETISKINEKMNPELYQKKISEQSVIIQQLMFENEQLKEKVQYLDKKTIFLNQIDHLNKKQCLFKWLCFLV